MDRLPPRLTTTEPGWSRFSRISRRGRLDRLRSTPAPWRRVVQKKPIAALQVRKSKNPRGVSHDSPDSDSARVGALTLFSERLGLLLPAIQLFPFEPLLE